MRLLLRLAAVVGLVLASCAAPVLVPTAVLPTGTIATNTAPAPSAVLPTATIVTSSPLPTATGTPSPSPTAAPPAQTIKIMPLGDSITFGTPNSSYGGYRHLLGTLLTIDGYRIDFVGSLQSGQGIIPDPDNEGHYGWTIPQIKAGIDSKGWLETYQPDIILLHIGTNDMEKRNTASAPGDLSALLDDILARLTHTHIIAAQIIPFRTGSDPAHQAYNAAVPGIVASKDTRVSTVDMRGILASDNYADHFHPNTGGYDKMARAWEPAIRAVISAAGSK